MKTNLFIFIIISIASFIPISECPGQSSNYDPGNYKIQKKLNKEKSAYELIHFIDKRSGEIVNTYYIEKNDPYINPDFERVELYKYQMTFLLPPEISSTRSHEYRTDNIKLKNDDSVVKPPVNFYSIFESVTVTKKFVLVSYSYQAYSGKPDLRLSHPWCPVGGNSTVLIFDKKGKLLNTLRDLGVYTFSTFYLSNDGKYLSYQFGQGKVPDGAFYIDKTLRVHDISTKKILFEGVGKACFGRSKGNTVFYFISDCNESPEAPDSHGVIIVDLKRKKQYHRCLMDINNGDCLSLARPTSEGIAIVHCQSGERLKFLYFENDFEVAEIR